MRRHVTRSAAVGLTVVFISAGPLLARIRPASAALPSDMCLRLEQRAADFAGESGIVLTDLESGVRCSVGGDIVLRSASLYKLFVMIEAFDQEAEGTLSFDDPLVIEPRHTIDDPPEYRATTSRTVSIDEALEEMITVSDNGSAIALLERLGAARVAAVPARLGLLDTAMGDVFMTSPRDIATLFEALYAGRVVSPLASGHMLALLRRQRVDYLLPAGLPPGTEIAHKTGTLDEYLHDAGIVTAPGGSFVLVVMTANPADPSYAEATTFIRAIAGLGFEGYAAPVVAVPTPARPEGTAGSVPVASGVVPAGRPATTAPAIAGTSGPEAAGEPASPVATVRPGGASGWWVPTTGREAFAGAAGLATLMLALASMALVGRRRGADHALDAAYESGRPRMVPVQSPDYAAHTTPATKRKDTAMRLRRQVDSKAEPGEEAAMATASPEPATTQRPAAEAVEAPPAEVVHALGLDHGIDSPRLERMARYFAAQNDLLNELRREVEQETAPLVDLLLRQRGTLGRVLENLDERLRPLEAYADGEEANLSQLQERLSGEGAEFLTRSFADYIAVQRERVAETRSRVDRQRLPFQQFGDAQRGAVETALARFDEDIVALEDILAQQRSVMTRLLDAMRSETFTTVRDYLAGRHEVLASLAERKVTDPAAIADALRAKAGAIPAGAKTGPGAQHVAEVLRVTEEADRRFAAPRDHDARAATAEATAPGELRDAVDAATPPADDEESDTATPEEPVATGGERV